MGRANILVTVVLCIMVVVMPELKVVSAEDDDSAAYDKWLEDMDKSSSPESVQPGEYNGKKKGHHHHSSSTHKRKGLELAEFTFELVAAASKKASSSSSPSPGPSKAARPTAPTPSPSKIPTQLSPAAAPTPFDPSAKTIVVAKDGSGHFKTVQAAVNSIPKSNSKRVIISIKPGIYREKVQVDVDWVTFQGVGPGLTEIQWGDTASTKGPNGKDLNTFGSASVGVNGNHFTARDISFRNTAPPPPGGAVGRQAVALRISGDFGAFFNVNFYGAQDTLYDHKGRHYFYKCYIEGSIDFIFGNGRSFYMECRLHSIANPTGSLTAQKRTSTDEETGFSFVNCVVTGSGSIYLGRAWGPASRVVFSLTYFDDIILPQGWFDWADPSRQKTVFYAEYKCFGPGANRVGRVSWSRVLTDKQAQPFLHTGFINGELWLTQT